MLAAFCPIANLEHVEFIILVFLLQTFDIRKTTSIFFLSFAQFFGWLNCFNSHGLINLVRSQSFLKK